MTAAKGGSVISGVNAGWCLAPSSGWGVSQTPGRARLMDLPPGIAAPQESGRDERRSASEPTRVDVILATSVCYRNTGWIFNAHPLETSTAIQCCREEGRGCSAETNGCHSPASW